MKNAKGNNECRGLLFPVAGPVAPVSIREDHWLEDLYREMRCSMVQIVVLAPGIDLLCDEEARFANPLQPNRVWLARRCNAIVRWPMFGDVVVLGRTEDGTRSRSLTLDEADEAIVRVMATNRELAVGGDHRPTHRELARWIENGIDWRQ